MIWLSITQLFESSLSWWHGTSSKGTWKTGWLFKKSTATIALQFSRNFIQGRSNMRELHIQQDIKIALCMSINLNLMNYIFNDYIFRYVRNALYIEMLVNEIHNKSWWKRTPNFLDDSTITQCNDNGIFMSPRVQHIGLLQKSPPSSRGCFQMSFIFTEKYFRILILNSPKFHSSNPIANRSYLVLVKASMTPSH